MVSMRLDEFSRSKASHAGAEPAWRSPALASKQLLPHPLTAGSFHSHFLCHAFGFDVFFFNLYKWVLLYLASFAQFVSF